MSHNYVDNARNTWKWPAFCTLVDMLRFSTLSRPRDWISQWRIRMFTDLLVLDPGIDSLKLFEKYGSLETVRSCEKVENNICRRHGGSVFYE